MNFGEKLREMRLSLDMTQEELAQKIGVQKQTISRYENSAREPNLKSAKLIANALGVSLEELTRQSKEDPQIKSESDKRIAELVTRLESASPAVRSAAIAAALAVLKSDLNQGV